MNKDITLHNLDYYLKIAILIGMVLLLMLIRVYKLDSCDLCKPYTDDKSQNEVVNEYFNECLKQYRIELDPIEYNFSKVNITFS